MEEGKNVTAPTLVEQEEKAFNLAQRQAKVYTSSSIVPQAYQGDKNIGNVIIALDIAKRLNSNPLMVMQNLYVVHGNPAWSSKFLIATINSCGRFTPLRYEFKGEEGKASWACRCYAYERSDKDHSERLEGSWVSLDMAQREGWSTKAGSKWVTMPDQMLRYRAAAFWQRTYAPEISMGLRTADEEEDISYAEAQAAQPAVIDDADFMKIDDPADKVKAAMARNGRKKKEEDAPQEGTEEQQ